VAFVGGAKIAASYDWRTAFIVMGVPGLLLAVFAWFGLKEPRLLPGRSAAGRASEPFSQSLRILFAKPSYMLVTVAGTLYFLVAYGAFIWVPPYMQRVLGADLASVGASYGLVSAVATVVGTLGGGALTDRLIKRDRRWATWVPGVALLLACPLYIGAFLVDSFEGFLVFALLGGLLIAAAIPAMFGLIHLICGSPRRAVAVAINFFFANLIGLGLGPVITGYLSDTFTASYGAVGLRYALLIALVMLVPAGLCYLAMTRHLARDTEA
jgi:predicted MFS family arabinose efflux permease